MALPAAESRAAPPGCQPARGQPADGRACLRRACTAAASSPGGAAICTSPLGPACGRRIGCRVLHSRREIARLQLQRAAGYRALPPRLPLLRLLTHLRLLHLPLLHPLLLLGRQERLQRRTMPRRLRAPQVGSSHLWSTRQTPCWGGARPSGSSHPRPRLRDLQAGHDMVRSRAASAWQRGTWLTLGVALSNPLPPRTRGITPIPHLGWPCGRPPPQPRQAPARGRPPPCSPAACLARACVHVPGESGGRSGARCRRILAAPRRSGESRSAAERAGSWERATPAGASHQPLAGALACLPEGAWGGSEPRQSVGGCRQPNFPAVGAADSRIGVLTAQSRDAAEPRGGREREPRRSGLCNGLGGSLVLGGTVRCEIHCG